MNPYDAYQQTAVTTQSKGRLVVLLYEGAIKFMKLAVKAVEQGDIEARHNYLLKAQDIIHELNAVLDMEAGGEIASNLRKLYDFMQKQLVQANIRNDTKKIHEVISLMEELNKGWKAITN